MKESEGKLLNLCDYAVARRERSEANRKYNSATFHSTASLPEKLEDIHDRLDTFIENILDDKSSGHDLSYPPKKHYYISGQIYDIEDLLKKLRWAIGQPK